MTYKKITPLILLLTFLFSNPAFSFTHNLKNSFQSGFEFDSNVFKTYNVFRKDGLLRAFLKVDADVRWPKSYLGFSYRLGGKKYFLNPEQDLFITLFELNYRQALHKKLYLISQSSLKLQQENPDADPDNLDINEDYLEFQQRIGFNYMPFSGLTLKPEADVYIFDFNSEYPSLSYYLQQYGLSVYRKITEPMEFGFLYRHKIYGFKNIDREDNLDDATILFRFSKIFFASFSYSFQTNASSIQELSFSNHKFSLIASVPIRFKRISNISSSLNPDLVLSFIGIVQIKNYADKVFVDDEGRRYLLSESEEDNFNILIFKITKNFTNNWAGEFKFTRHSNEFANTGQKYRRSTFYLGARYSY